MARPNAGGIVLLVVGLGLLLGVLTQKGQKVVSVLKEDSGYTPPAGTTQEQANGSKNGFSNQPNSGQQKPGEPTPGSDSAFGGFFDYWLNPAPVKPSLSGEPSGVPANMA